MGIKLFGLCLGVLFVLSQSDAVGEKKDEFDALSNIMFASQNDENELQEGIMKPAELLEVSSNDSSLDKKGNISITYPSSESTLRGSNSKKELQNVEHSSSTKGEDDKGKSSIQIEIPSSDGSRYIMKSPQVILPQEKHISDNSYQIQNNFSPSSPSSEVEKLKFENAKLRLQLENADLKSKLAVSEQKILGMRLQSLRSPFPTQYDANPNIGMLSSSVTTNGGTMPVQMMYPQARQTATNQQQQTQSQPSSRGVPQIQSAQQQIRQSQQYQQQEQRLQYPHMRFKELRSTMKENEKAPVVGWDPVQHPTDPYFQALGQANMARLGLGYHPMNSAFNPLYGPGGGAATPQALTSEPTIRGTNVYESQYPGYNPAAVTLPLDVTGGQSGITIMDQIMDKTPKAAVLSVGTPGNVRLPPVAPPVPPRPAMGTPPPPVSEIINTPDVLPAPTPPTSPSSMRRFPTQYDTGVNVPPNVSPLGRRGKAEMAETFMPGEAPVQASPAQPLSRSATMRIDQRPAPVPL
eukprot:g1807.t1